MTAGVGMFGLQRLTDTFSTITKVMSSVCGMPWVNSSMAFKNFCSSA